MSATDMAQEGYIQSGVVGIRAPDGEIARTIKIYKPVHSTSARTLMQPTEQDENVVVAMARIFEQYIQITGG